MLFRSCVMLLTDRSAIFSSCFPRSRCPIFDRRHGLPTSPPILPPLHIMYFTLLKTSQLSFALWLGGSFFFFFALAFSFLFNNTNLFCNSFSHSNALWLAHNTMAGMRSHKTNTHTEPTRHLQDLYLLLFTYLFYPGLSFITL